MTWFWSVLVIVAVVGFVAWASRRRRRHSGDGTMDEVKRNAERRYPGGGFVG